MSQKPINPFEHHHPHYHDDDESEVMETLDPAQQSMADALKVSFFVLKMAMLVVFVLYLCSGFFNVKQGEEAVVLRFGKQTGSVYPAGGPHFAFPYPIDQVERVDVSERQVNVFKSFWFNLKEGSAAVDAMQGTPGPLNPEQDGSLLTGDANIVHARWTVKYRISNVTDYLKHRPTPQGEQLEMERAKALRAATDDLVRTSVEQGIVSTLAEVKADDFVKGKADPRGREESPTAKARKRAQAALNASGAGIEVLEITLTKATYPLSVLSSVSEVNKAQSEKAKAIEEAQAEWAETLGQTAGDAYRELNDMINEYELAFVEGNQKRIAELEGKIDNAFESLEIRTSEGPKRIEGDVASIIEEAKAFRTNVVETMRGEAEAFAGNDQTKGALQRYRENPEIFLNRRWQDAIQVVFNHELAEYMWLKGQPYLELNRKSSVRKAIEEAADKQQQHIDNMRSQGKEP